MGRERNQTLELIKLFAAYMVVFIHVEFYGVIGEIVTVLARFAVPLFFLVSGFYSYKISEKKILSRAVHLFKLLIFGAVLHESFKVFYYLAYGNIEGLYAHFISYIDPVMWVKVFLLNEPIRGAYLWYMIASIYVYIIYYFAVKLRISEKVISITSLSLLGIHIVISEGLMCLGIYLSVTFYNSFLLMGIPFFGLGLLARKHEEKLFGCPMCLVYISLFFGITESLVSRFILGKTTLYIGTLFVLFALVVFFIKFRERKYPAPLVKTAECSLYIYLLHVPVREALKMLYDLLNIDLENSVAMQMIHPIAVCIVTTAVSFLFVLAEKKIKASKRAKALAATK